MTYAEQVCRAAWWDFLRAATKPAAWPSSVTGMSAQMNRERLTSISCSVNPLTVRYGSAMRTG